MSNQNLFGKDANPGGLVDKLLGDAYVYVKVVADQIDVIKTLAENIVHVRDAAEAVKRNTIEVTGVVPALGVTGFVTLPETIAETSIMDSMVVIKDTNDALYSESSGHFTTKISGGFLEVSLDAGAPADMAGGEVRWTLTHGE